MHLDGIESHSQKIALITFHADLAWYNHKLISKNLVTSYKLAFKGFTKHFALEMNNQLKSIWNCAKDVYEMQPDRIVFINHPGDTLSFLQALKCFYELRRSPELVFHIYGVPFGREWLSAWPYMKDLPCLFVAASTRQQALLGRMMQRPESAVVFPFPIDQRVFRLRPPLRQLWRSRLGFGPKHKVLIYSGRLSLQKNILLLVQEAAKLMRERKDIHLLLAGASDDFGAPLFGWNHPLGAHDARLEQVLGGLEPELRARIRRLGPVNRETLCGLYNAADAFVSFSLHHDEDYGMAVAEALATGLPVCLTEWGGYAQFLEPEGNGVGVKVGLTQHGLRLSKEECSQSLLSLLSMAEASEKIRRARARHAQSNYTLSGCVKKLQAMHAQEIPIFQGYSPLLTRLAFQFHSASRTFPGGPQKGGLYEEVYSSYAAFDL